ncbi:hypothetical protein BC628DRAFT_1397331 [Trametes gibbosa]|nr:hypothetical protein BC628DRAFT_1397331 [Trametes gibbosa]
MDRGLVLCCSLLQTQMTVVLTCLRLTHVLLVDALFCHHSRRTAGAVPTVCQVARVIALPSGREFCDSESSFILRAHCRCTMIFHDGGTAEVGLVP